MKSAALAAFAFALVLAGPAFGAETATTKPLTPQQQKMKDCNAQAAGKTGDERKQFMSQCLKGGSTASATKPMTQQEKMKACNAQATGKTGDERKQFMSQCLKGDGSGAAAH